MWVHPSTHTPLLLEAPAYSGTSIHKVKRLSSSTPLYALHHLAFHSCCHLFQSQEPKQQSLLPSQSTWSSPTKPSWEHGQLGTISHLGLNHPILPTRRANKLLLTQRMFETPSRRVKHRNESQRAMKITKLFRSRHRTSTLSHPNEMGNVQTSLYRMSWCGKWERQPNANREEWLCS